MRIPIGQYHASLDLARILDGKRCTIGHFMTLALTTVFFRNDDFTVARNHDHFVARIDHVAHCRREARDTR